ncbi:spermatogenesis-associated protein 31H1 isoform X2 [Zophobas morio]
MLQWARLRCVAPESCSSGSTNNSHCPSSPRPKMTVNSQSGPRSPRPPDDLISTATSALRRLHFKTGRNATKNSTKSQSVPKVIVMGSSTASETTINTSTDSSNTIVTTVTATDGDNTEDSLDITEPLDYFNSDNNAPDGSKILQPVPVSPKTPTTAKQQTPPTAKHDTKFNFEVETPKAVLSKHDNRFVFDANEVSCLPEEKSVEKLMEEQIEALKLEARRRNSYKAAAQGDFNKMSVAKAMERTSPKDFRRSYRAATHDMDKKDGSPKEHRRSVRKRLDVEGKEKPERTSPKRRAERNLNSSPETNEDSPKPKHRHKKTSRRHHSPSKQREKFNYDEKHIAKYREKARMTPPLPDLRVDFFNETVDACQVDSLHVSGEKRGSVCLNKCLREVGAQLEASATSPINVTTNPLENSVHFGGRKAPQATIVVQQPSLSLDHSNVSTILLKNGSEFVSNVESAGNKLSFKRQKEENMKQLLDVANNLTLEEIHDFEMRYGSPHHNRSQSVKTPGRSSGRPNYLCLPQQRSRVASMPNTGVEEEYYRLRHFSITGKGVVNRGDSLKSRRSRSNNSVASSNSSTEQLPGAVSAAGSARTSASCSLASSRESSTSAPGPTPYKVLMLGGPAVGKSSLVSQFMTSEYLHAYDTSIDDESGEKSVSVLLAGEESELTFIDFATADLSPDSCINKYTDPNAYCVVYSSSDRSSLACAEKILQKLWTLDTISTKAVILVANKADLVRSKVVSTEEGKSMATGYDCKYIETSVGINHNVDELLVGILTQIRLKLENPERSRDLFRKRSSSKKNLNRNRSPVSGTGTPTGSAQNSPKKYRGSRTSASLKVRNLLGKVWARDSKSKSCENLHVL